MKEQEYIVLNEEDDTYEVFQYGMEAMEYLKELIAKDGICSDNLKVVVGYRRKVDISITIEGE